MKNLKKLLLPVIGVLAFAAAPAASAQLPLATNGALIGLQIPGSDGLTLEVLSASSIVNVGLGGQSLVNIPNTANGDPVGSLLNQLGSGATPIDGTLSLLTGLAPAGGAAGGGLPSLPGLELIDALGGGGDLPLDPALLLSVFGILSDILASGGSDLPLDVAPLTELLDALQAGEDLPLDLKTVTDLLGLSGNVALDLGELLGPLIGLAAGG